MPQNDLTRLDAELISYQEIHELPGDWAPAALLQLLADLEIDAEGTAPGDLQDLVLMALGDLETDEAAAAVLQAVFGADMPAGVRANLASDLEDDRPWENFADLSQQEGIFTATVLLQRAFPRSYGKPDATRTEVAFRAPTPADAALLAGAPPALILRALAPGLGPRSIVTRLYADGLRSGAFPEAEHILWRRTAGVDPADPRRVLVELFGAHSFLGTLDDAAPWQAEVKLDPSP